MANEEHLKILRQGVEAWNKWREENPNIKPDLREANLTRNPIFKYIFEDLKGMNLRKIDFSEVDLRKTNLIGANLNKANLNKANLSEANLSEALLRESSLKGTNLIKTELIKTELNKANLSEANLYQANLYQANLYQANLSKAYLSKAYLGGVILIEANLYQTNFYQADFNTNLIQSILKTGEDWDKSLIKSILNGGEPIEVIYLRTDSKKTNLNRANLSEANLSEANLSEANLSGSNLIRTNFTKTNLSKANLTGANLYQAKLHQTKVYQAKLWKTNYNEAIITETNIEGAYLTMPEEKEKPTYLFKESKVIFSPENKGQIIWENHNYAPEQKQSLAEAAKEIQQLLEQLDKSYSSDTTSGRMQIATAAISEIENNPDLTKRIISALKAGGVSAFEQFLNHPAASFVIGALEDWQNKS